MPIINPIILRQIRRRITDGHYPPGTPLPTVDAIAAEHEIDTRSAKAVLTELTAEGFLEPDTDGGLAVAAKPPHLHGIGLVFSSSPKSPDWGHFWTCLVAAAEQLSSDDHQLRVYYSASHQEGNPQFQNLIRDCSQHRLAGLIFGSAPYYLKQTAPLTQIGLARVTIASKPFTSDIPAVDLEKHAFYDKALSRFAQRGRKRVALILPSSVPLAHENEFLEAVAGHGLTTADELRQGISLKHPQWAGRTVQLLMTLPAGRRPDCMLITDDNLAPAAIQGVLDAGFSVPDDLDIVAHANFPHVTETPVPVIRLGYDAGDIIRACIAELDRQLAGNPPSRRMQTIAPRFDHEPA